LRSITDYQLVPLPDGAFTVRSLADRETFHPVAGPVVEAEALYARQLRLRGLMQQSSGEFVIWDVGMGAAANPITALRCTEDLLAPVRIVSFDHTTAALEFALLHAEKLNYLRGWEPVLESLLSHNRAEVRHPRNITWELRLGDFPSLMASAAAGRERIPSPDAIFYDAFSPARNPEMWTLDVLRNMRQQLTQPCSLATFSRSTITRATLLLAGFHVGIGVSLAGKEETTIAATDAGLIEKLLPREWLTKAQRSHSAEPLRESKYVQQPLRPATLDALKNHPQFA
jgi:queuine tRNA-ribosyltransferase